MIREITEDFERLYCEAIRIKPDDPIVNPLINGINKELRSEFRIDEDNYLVNARRTNNGTILFYMDSDVYGYAQRTAEYTPEKQIKTHSAAVQVSAHKPKLTAVPTTTPISADLTTVAVEKAAKAKTKAVAELLGKIVPVDLIGVCVSLGWSGGDDDYPKQKHFKIAIVHSLFETAKKQGGHIIYDAGFFYVFNSACWSPLDDPEVKFMLKDAAIRMAYTEIECRDSDFIAKLFQQAKEDGFFFERNTTKQSIINLKNGSLVINETGANLKPFDYRDFITHQLEFNYKPTAINSVFQAFLEQMQPDADTRRTLQQVLGYLFIKGLKMEKIFFLCGNGSNGKSVVFEVITGVIGQENISSYSLESLTDDKGYHRAMIKDKVVNYGTDIRMNKIDAGMFKTLASGEPIEARLPYSDPFIMRDYAKLIFNINKLDTACVEHTHGFKRRIVTIPFTVTIPDDKQDRDLPKKILQDRAGVLNWIIEGAKQVISSRDIFISDECENFKNQFIKESDSVAMFEEYISDEMPGIRYYKTVKTAHTEYTQFCKDAGHKLPLGRNNFSKRMELIGFTKTKNTDGWYLEKNYPNKIV
jgi:putative DNA primase/helicase